jgi:hypothetical protein
MGKLNYSAISDTEYSTAEKIVSNDSCTVKVSITFTPGDSSYPM